MHYENQLLFKAEVGELFCGRSDSKYLQAMGSLLQLLNCAVPVAEKLP